MGVADVVEGGRRRFAPDRGERTLGPPRGAGRALGQVALVEPADVGAFEGMTGQLSAGGVAVEQQHVHPEPGEPHALTVDDREQSARLALDAGLLVDFLHRHLGRRVAHVGPTRRIQPDSGVFALHQQQLAVVVADHGADRHLGGDVARHADSDRLHPLLDEVVLLALDLERFQFVVAQRAPEHLVGGGLDVGGHVEHLFEPLALVQALGEAEPGPGDRGERLTPADEIPRAPGARTGAAVVGAPGLGHRRST